MIKKHHPRENGANRKLVRAMDLQMINLEVSTAGVPRELLNNRWMCTMSEIWKSELGTMFSKYHCSGVEKCKGYYRKDETETLTKQSWKCSLTKDAAILVSWATACATMDCTISFAFGQEWS